MNCKYIIAGMLALCPLFAVAADGDTDKPDYLYVPEVLLDSEGKGTVKVYLNTYVEEYNTFRLDIYLPEGFAISKDRRGNYAFKFNTEDDVVYDHTMASADNVDAENRPYVRILGTSMTSTFIMPGDNLLFSFNITAPEGYSETEDGEMKNLEFAEGVEVETAHDHFLPDVSFAIIPDPSTGVENVGVEEGAVTVFSLQGVELLRDAPASSLRSLPAGLYIINGAKKLIR
ncbi:MAG: hypothetical protein K2L16_07795 [Muribaculaceae bacterium]|nr:hypothetical protein [Muribaculaceae bacterium]